MEKKRILIFLMMLVLLAGCGGGKFVAEKATLETATKAMNAFASSVETADTPALLTQALGTFSTAIEKVVPAMKKMTEEHADWQDAPPEALKDSFTSFEAASEKFQGAMPKVMQFASQHADNPALQSALEKFKTAVSGL